jgi:hypothetical protein
MRKTTACYQRPGQYPEILERELYASLHRLAIGAGGAEHRRALPKSSDRGGDFVYTV